jgi:bacillithiol biosynthesis cysteine-adding enzyme BshC
VIKAISRDIGGSALARSALAGELPAWYGAKLRGATDWKSAASEVADEFGGRQWLIDLLPALEPSGEAESRLRASAAPGGLVVTGGQQPGLFGGPLYVLHKALTVLEFANALSTITGRPVAPIFWAATDDADFIEASHVSVVRQGKLDRLAVAESSPSGRAMAETPLGDVSAQLARLEEACDSAPDERAMAAVRASYHDGVTVGDAYLALLRSLLEPLGIAVLDASHRAVRVAGHASIANALGKSEEIADALKARSRAITDAGYHAQVADVPNLSLVFETMDGGTRRRVPIRAAREISNNTPAGRLGPNVLLRPIMERQILPTVTYVGGAGEVAYFAQVSAVAEAMGVASPRISPRWGGTLIEPSVDNILARLGATIADFADPHAIEGRIAREGVSANVREAIDGLRGAVAASAKVLRGDPQTSDPLARSIGTMQAGVEHRLQRLERRYAAAVKQAGSESLRDVAAARASLYPDRAPQERVLSFIPFLARQGSAVIDAIRERAREHVSDVISGG